MAFQSLSGFLLLFKHQHTQVLSWNFIGFLMLQWS